MQEEIDSLYAMKKKQYKENEQLTKANEYYEALLKKLRKELDGYKVDQRETILEYGKELAEVKQERDEAKEEIREQCAIEAESLKFMSDKPDHTAADAAIAIRKIPIDVESRGSPIRFKRGLQTCKIYFGQPLHIWVALGALCSIPLISYVVAYIWRYGL